ncbi:MAG: hypothetical protein HY043_00620 [Verrucomicrobia bacterium]|nr:hypothetical protein [Verrucomicrobiota bacterium]
MKYIKPPTITGTSLINNTATINWSINQPGSYSFIFRAASPAGPFTRLNGRPTSLTTYSTTASATATNYMVRSYVTTATGIGSYGNLSQGVVTSIP